MQESAGDLWVFGYGSLMWRPGFPYLASYPARLDGWRRRFCIVSRYYRGSDRRPGLVLGLDRGGVCEGRAYHVAAGNAPAVLAYLREREQISGVYREAHVEVLLCDATHRRRWALAYIAERAHPSYVGALPLRTQSAIIAGARGSTGTNLGYFLETLKALRARGIREAELERILVGIGPVRALRTEGGPGRISANRSGYPMSVWPRRPVRKLADVKRFAHRRRMGVRLD